MKGIKRVLGVVLAVALLMTSFAVTVSASAFSDVSDNAKYANAVSVLSKLNIIKGYEDGSFQPENDVTRAEFTTMLMRVMGVANDSETVWTDTPFSDLGGATWAIGNIRTAYGMGIINGYEDGTFQPNANVKYEEAIKMVVCALGYGTGITMDGPTWYSNYYAQAMAIGILNNVDGTLETNATRACIAQLIFGSLEVELVENNVLSGKTLLDYLGLIKNTGRISANNNTSLNSPDVNLNENQVEIYAKDPDSSSYTTNVYTTDDTTIKDLLGYQVTYYYKLDRATNERTLVLAETKSPKVLGPIDANLLDVDSSTNNSIKYYQDLDSDKTLSASVASGSTVIYNGKLYGSNAAESVFTKDMLPKIGSVKLVDSGSSGSYDMVFIESYVPYYVSSISTSSKTVTDTLTRIAASTDKTIELNEESSAYDLSIVDEDGKKLSFSSISKGDVVNYKESNNNGGTILKTAVVSKEKASGTVTSVNGDTIVVGGKTYEYSPYAPWEVYDSATTPLSKPAINDNATFSLDINGNILAYEKTATNTNTAYGYIMGAEPVTADGVKTVGLYMLTASNKKEEIYMHSTVKIDGTSYKSSSQADDILSALAASASLQNNDSGSTNAQYTQLIKYTTRSDGKITNIVTATGTNTGGSVTTDSLSLYTAVSGISMSCNSSKQLSGNNTTVSTSNAAVFVVPTNRRDYDSYKKSSSTEFKNGNSYIIDAFDISSSRSAAAIVLYGKDASESVDAETGIYKISEVYSTTVDGEARMKVSGTLFRSGSSSGSTNFDEVVSTASESLVNGLSEGDIVRFGADTEGYLSLERKDILWSNGQSAYIDVDDSNSTILASDPYSAEFVAIYGSVLFADSGDDVIVADELINGNYSGSAEEYTITRADFSSAKAFVYNMDNRGRVSDIVEEGSDFLDLLQPYSDGANADPSKMFVYMSKGRVKLVIIFAE